MVELTNYAMPSPHAVAEGVARLRAHWIGYTNETLILMALAELLEPLETDRVGVVVYIRALRNELCSRIPEKEGENR